MEEEDYKRRLEHRFRVLARQNRKHIDDDINGPQPVYQAYFFLRKICLVIKKLDLLSDTEFTSMVRVVNVRGY